MRSWLTFAAGSEISLLQAISARAVPSRAYMVLGSFAHFAPTYEIWSSATVAPAAKVAASKMLPGAAFACCNIFVGYPFDTVKTRLQLQLHPSSRWGLAVGRNRWSLFLRFFFSWYSRFIDRIFNCSRSKEMKSSWKNEETQASLPWLWLISAVNQWNRSNLWKPSMPNCEALLTGAGSWRSLCTSKLVVSRCFSSALVPSLKTTCGVCCLWMLQWIILWRFTGRLHGRLNFLPLQHGQDLGAVQAGRFSPRWAKQPWKTHIPGYRGGLLVNPSLTILKRSKCTVYSLHVLHIDMTWIF